MKKFLYTIICVVLAVSCNNEIDLAGRQVTPEYNILEKFSGVGVQDGFELYLHPVNVATSTVRIESDENAIIHTKYKIKDGILYFYKDPEIEFPDNVSVKVYVTKDSLDNIVASSAKVQIMDTLRTKDINLVLSDHSLLTGRIECENIRSAIYGSTVELAGTSDTVQVNIDGGSSVKMFEMESKDLKINIAGGSFAEITVHRELDVRAKEKSALHYKGTPFIRNLVSDDDSEIKKIEQ
jgi:CxxC motif-containing protein